VLLAIVNLLGHDADGYSSRLAMIGVCKLWNAKFRNITKQYWDPFREAVTLSLKERRPRRGLDDTFLAVHALMSFSEDNVANTDVLPFAVATNDLTMVRQVRRLWPCFTPEQVMSFDCQNFIKRMAEGAEIEVLREMSDWWGFETMQEAILTALENGSSCDRIHWPAVRNLRDLLLFLREMRIETDVICRHNKDLIANVIGMCGADRLSVLRMLREWGVGIREVRQCNRDLLWLELSCSADSIRELATWGLCAADASYKKCIVVDWAEHEFNNGSDVRAALTRTLRMNLSCKPLYEPRENSFFGAKTRGFSFGILARTILRNGVTDSRKSSLIKHAVREGAWLQLNGLREYCGFTCDDLLREEPREMLVRHWVLRGETCLLEDLVSGWKLVQLGGAKGLMLLREMIARVPLKRDRDKAQHVLDRLLGRGWELDT